MGSQGEYSEGIFLVFKVSEAGEGPGNIGSGLEGVPTALCISFWLALVAASCLERLRRLSPRSAAVFVSLLLWLLALRICGVPSKVLL